MEKRNKNNSICIFASRFCCEILSEERKNSEKRKNITKKKGLLFLSKLSKKKILNGFAGERKQKFQFQFEFQCSIFISFSVN